MFPMDMRKILILLLLLSAAAARSGPTEDVLAVPRRIPRHEVAPRGELLLFPVSSRWLAVAGSYDAFLNGRLLEEFGPRLALADRLYETGRTPRLSYRRLRQEVEDAWLPPRNSGGKGGFLSAWTLGEARRLREWRERLFPPRRGGDGKLVGWSYDFLYRFAAAEVAETYLPRIRDNFQDPGYFRLTASGGPVGVERRGYWVNAIGARRVPVAVRPEEKRQVQGGDLVFFTYWMLDRPLRNGERLTVESRGGERAELTYDDAGTLSRAIKVNQVGYLADAGEKYAYLGLWLGGELGPLPTGEFVGKPFHLRRAADGSVAFTGKLAPRSKLQKLKRPDGDIPLDGEEVLEMDFSEFREEGRYFVQVPGVGRSWEFVIGPDAIGRAFYVQTRGLFLQRSGIAKERAQTRWTIGIDHPWTYRGGFIPDDSQYADRIFDEKGNKADIGRHFEMVKATATDELLPGVRGGWWDAGDFDRRPYHFQVVDSLLSVYLLFPENFRDGQLDLPESGNGIPDIVDEAAWGVEVWRRAQLPSGGVGCWIESTSHPGNPDPETDAAPYYLALPTRGGSLEYSAYAAKLARAYRQCGRADLAERFFESAERAWRFAMNPANRTVSHFTMPKLGKLVYSEPEELSPSLLYKAALNLRMYRQAPEYDAVLEAADFGKVLEECRQSKMAYFLSELAEDDSIDFMRSSQYRKMVRARAAELIASQRQLAYRNVNWPMESRYFLSLAWGHGLPFLKGSYLVMAWQITGEARYRDAALLLADWMLGANPMGRSLTTGLGKVYPVRLLSLPQQAREARQPDPIPGLTLYGFTGMNDYRAASRIYRFALDARRDHRFPGININLLPRSLGGEGPIGQKECYQEIQRVIPVWRRFANLEGEAVAQNEYTVWETMAPAAAAYGALLPPGWMPPPEWKEQEPETDISKIPGYIFLP